MASAAAARHDARRRLLLGDGLRLALVRSAQRFKNVQGYVPQLAAPSSFTEHLFVRQFFAALPMPALADKLAAREHVRARLGEDVLPALAWVGDSVDELLAIEPPSGRYVLKPNHGSGWLTFLDLPADLSRRRDEIAKLAGEWLSSRFGYEFGEWQYSTFKPRLFLEEFLEFKPGGTPDDYKFFCFHGKARVINFHVDRFTHHRSALYDTTWQKSSVHFGRETVSGPRPENLEAMLAAAEAIAAGLEFARIDLYSDCKEVIKFGEVTLTPGAFVDRFSDFQFDRWLGAFLTPQAAGQGSETS
jgi:hypothetical protein